MKSIRFNFPTTHPAPCLQTEGLRIPFLRPNPPKLSLQSIALAEIEESGIFSNYGPVNTQFEERVSRALFGAEKRCVTVANATLGLMLAIKRAVGWNPRARYA